MYTRRSDAFAALKRYNNVLLDGKPMRIEIVGANPGMPVSARVNVSGLNGTRKRTVVMTYAIFFIPLSHSSSLSLSEYLNINDKSLMSSYCCCSKRKMIVITYDVYQF